MVSLSAVPAHAARAHTAGQFPPAHARNSTGAAQASQEEPQARPSPILHHAPPHCSCCVAEGHEACRAAAAAAPRPSATAAAAAQPCSEEGLGICLHHRRCAQGRVRLHSAGPSICGPSCPSANQCGPEPTTAHTRGPQACAGATCAALFEALTQRSEPRAASYWQGRRQAPWGRRWHRSERACLDGTLCWLAAQPEGGTRAPCCC